jgi:hypothetical protein
MANANSPVQTDAAADTRPAYYCQNPRCAGTATFAGTCCGKPMVTR